MTGPDSTICVFLYHQCWVWFYCSICNWWDWWEKKKKRKKKKKKETHGALHGLALLQGMFHIWRFLVLPVDQTLTVTCGFCILCELLCPLAVFNWFFVFCQNRKRGQSFKLKWIREKTSICDMENNSNVKTTDIDSLFERIRLKLHIIRIHSYGFVSFYPADWHRNLPRNQNMIG